MELRAKINENPWGNAYKIALTRLRGKNASAPTCPELMPNIVKGLFPKQPPLRVFQHTTVLLIKVTASEVLFCERFTTCLQDGVFPEPCKRQRLVLIAKGNKPP